tara:strand:- start:87 stop:188 length:102 start_codon:yes stop_codon:yes gene_type:complete
MAGKGDVFDKNPLRFVEELAESPAQHRYGRFPR